MLDALLKELLRQDPELNAEAVADAFWLSQIPGFDAEVSQGQTSARTAERDKAQGDVSEPPPSVERSDGPGQVEEPSPTTLSRVNRERRASLYASGARRGKGRGASAAALPFATPDCAALPAAWRMVHAIRALHLHKGDHARPELDVGATVEATAQMMGALQVKTRYPSRASHTLYLIHDRSWSASLWDKAAREMVRALSHTGAFAHVRLLELREVKGAPRPLPEEGGRSLDKKIPREGGASSWGLFHKRHQTAVSWKALATRDGGDAVCVFLTDAVGAWWHGGEAAARLQDLGRRLPVALLMLTPESMWRRSALGRSLPVWLEGPHQAVPNAQLQVQARGRRPYRAEALKGRAIPVLGLSEDWLARWVSLLQARVAHKMPGILLPEMPLVEPGLRRSARRGEVGEPETPEQAAEALLWSYTSYASPAGLRLLRHLAASPLNMALIRLVARACAPKATQADIAEILLSGLIERLEEGPPDEVSLGFVPQAREQILRATAAHEAFHTLEEVSRHLNVRVGEGRSFMSWLRDPTGQFGSHEIEVEEGEGVEARAFAEVAASVLRAMGGEYRALGDALVQDSSHAEDAAEGEALSGAQEDALEVMREQAQALSSYLYGFQASALTDALLQAASRAVLERVEPAPVSLILVYLKLVVAMYRTLPNQHQRQWSKGTSKTINPFLRRLRQREHVLPDGQRVWVRGLDKAHKPKSDSWAEDARRLHEELREHLGLEPTSSHMMSDDWVWVEPGLFLMGSPKEELERYNDEDQEWVELTQGFWVQPQPVTQAQWEDVMGNNPSLFKEDPQCPVEQVSWYDAIAYCNALSLKEGLEPFYHFEGEQGEPGSGQDDGYTIGSISVVEGSRGYRLLSEAEWEYMCRADTGTATHAGDLSHDNWSELDPVLDKIAWYNRNSDGKTHSVCQKAPNDWGLYDSLGNVFEWCWDWFSEDKVETSQESPKRNPIGPESGSRRVSRGGSWFSDGHYVRAASRFHGPPGDVGYDLGFRCARTP